MKVKIFFPIAMALVSMLGLSSCKKYLDVSPQSAFDEQFVFSNVANTTSALMGVYEQLTGDNGYGGRLSMMYPYDTDEFIGVTNASAPDNNSRDLSRYNLQATNGQLTLPFQQLYTGIERANICIKNIPAMAMYNNGSETEKQQLRRLYGEALTLRAQFYLELIRNWGDLPAIFEPAIDQSDLYLPKTDRDLIYDRIIEDLKLAGELVPWRNDAGVGIDERITKGAVKGLRARIALYRGGYSLRSASEQMERKPDYLSFYKIARDECAEIMQHRDKHNLNPTFQDVFKNYIDAFKIEPNGEVMFEVAMGKDISGRIGYYDGPRFYASSGTAQLGNSSVRAVPVYFYSFNALDTRRDVTLAPYYNNADKTKAVQTMVNMVSGKFRADWWNPAPTSASQQTGINWPILRFSDVLLMFAEAENELNSGPTAAAKSAYEEVRKRGFKGNETAIGTTPSGKDDFFNAIVDERYFEFGGEGIRKYDLIRWNLLASKIAETRSNYTKMLNKVAPYNNLPQSMYYKSASTEVIFSNSLYSPAPAATPVGYTKVAWVSSITAVWITNFAQYFKPNHSELFPLPQSVVESNPKLKQDYGY
ncbi:Starch-binding associating with outer membrane [Pedobacter sp. ok626]|uniref:RagB/SusD family nutrient uptake outer membrane protein n=1 Tax=Pedobacter sp. ok626 TaxID=1761882 RepID=UPI000881FD44|nr:RagB/SusD family nutrient uptake outer membrane protein [Pedobacter sp. ok626]SDK14478.1 Starch-binding associating with outer membrane [Pedobacter sp. ok626]